jgi:Ca-activated chloride channel homolog
MFWNKNISSIEYWFIAIFIIIYLIYFIKIIYVSNKIKVSARAAFLKFLPRLIAFTFLIIALLEPSFGNYEDAAKTKTSNKQIYFLVDVSKSMDAMDIAPTRLEKVKFEIKKIVNYFQTEKFAIISFASNASLHCTVTNDIENLNNMIGILNTDNYAEKGTNLNEALSLGIEKVTNANRLSSALMIVLTDGEDFSDITEANFNNIKRKRINLLIIGVGTSKGANVMDKSGNFIKNKNDNPLITKLEAEYLKSVAAKANGKYFEYNNINTPTAAIIETIDNIKGIIGSQSLDAANPGNKFHYPLLFAIIIICLDLLISIRIFNF